MSHRTCLSYRSFTPYINRNNNFPSLSFLFTIPLIIPPLITVIECLNFIIEDTKMFIWYTTRLNVLYSLPKIWKFLERGNSVVWWTQKVFSTFSYRTILNTFKLYNSIRPILGLYTKHPVPHHPLIQTLCNTSSTPIILWTKQQLIHRFDF